MIEWGFWGIPEKIIQNGFQTSCPPNKMLEEIKFWLSVNVWTQVILVVEDNLPYSALIILRCFFLISSSSSSSSPSSSTSNPFFKSLITASLFFAASHKLTNLGRNHLNFTRLSSLSQYFYHHHNHHSLISSSYLFANNPRPRFDDTAGPSWRDLGPQPDLLVHHQHYILIVITMTISTVINTITIICFLF